MVFGYVEDGKVKTISKFSGGKKVMGGKITVFDVDGKQLLQGVTDDNGEFSFDIPSKKGLKIELEAAMGHKNISEIPADQLGVPDAAPSVGEKADETAGSSSSEVTTTEEIPAASDGQDADLEARIEKVLDRKVMPILQMMAEKEDKPGFKDIVGGIGYIVGLMGLFLYMKSRKEK
jgi:nickel transport protein